MERLNRSIGETLAKLLSSYQRDWDEYLGAVQFAHDTAHHTSISDIPYRVVFKELPRTLLDVAAAVVVPIFPPTRYLRARYKYKFHVSSGGTAIIDQLSDFIETAVELEYQDS